MQLSLDEWMRNQVPSGGASMLDSVGPASRMLREVLRSEQHTAATVGSAFWQSYVHSSAFRDSMAKAQLDVEPVFKSEILIVGQVTGQFLLLLTHPALTANTVTMKAEATRRALSDGWSTLNDARGRPRDDMFGSIPPDVMRMAALEADSAGDFWAVVTGPMPEELTTVGNPPSAVLSSVKRSTAGAWVQDVSHRVGVTSAYHAVAKGVATTVGGNPAAYVYGDELTDSCFLEVTFHGLTKATHGPLKLAPRMNEMASYVGSASSGQARVVAFNYELPYIDPNLQQTIRTEYVTAQGDSGAALVDSNDYILGFAHSRSAPNAPAAYSAWIWANSVFQKLNITTY